MNPFGMSRRQRFCNRVLFYLIVGATLWVLNWAVVPTPEDEMAKWEAQGVARAFIAAPPAEVERYLMSLSR
ncbi:MAG TPA: hypothetical protein PLA50_17825 [Bacteroidia bacterium]|nr:hypothetical protein [Bacteroidia bacterium]